MVQAQLISSASFLPDVLFRRGSLLAPFRLPSILETSIVGNIVVAFSSSLPSPPRDRKNETREKPLRSGRRITRNEKKSLFLLAIFNFKFSMRPTARIETVHCFKNRGKSQSMERGGALPAGNEKRRGEGLKKIHR